MATWAQDQVQQGTDQVGTTVSSSSAPARRIVALLPIECSCFFPVESVPDSDVSESEEVKKGGVPSKQFNAKHLPSQVSASGCICMHLPSLHSFPAFSLP